METISDRQILLAPEKNGAFKGSDYHTSMITALTDHCARLMTALERLPAQTDVLSKMALRLLQCLQSGRKVLVAGNGGSAAEAQHFAAELVGRFKRDRAPYPVMALTTDTAILTSVANDYSYQDVFARQVLAFGHPDDMLIVLSTSGESENLLRAVQAGRRLGMFLAAIVGQRECTLARMVNLVIQAPVIETATIQELHLVIIHLLCDIVESHLYATEKRYRL